jgi:hypothetical protein
MVYRIEFRMWSRKKTTFCRSFHRLCTKCETKDLQKVFADLQKTEFFAENNFYTELV